MNYELRFRPQVVEDVAEAFGWYEERGEGLGREFLRAYYAALANLSREPEMYAPAHRNFRRVLLRRFPYAVYFLIEERTVIVLLVFHSARDPRTLRRALRTRKEEPG